jgi:Type II intron maturase
MAAIARFRNRAIQRLKAQNVTIAKAALNRLRSKILKQIDSIAKQLNINHPNQKFDTYAAILAFKSIGETLAKSLKLPNFEKLTLIMKKIDESTDISNPRIKRLYNQFKSEAELNEEIAANCIWEQIKRLEIPEIFKIDGIVEELKQLQKNVETKAEELTKRTKNKLIDEKREKLLQIHTKKQNKKIFDRIEIPLSKEEKKILSGLAEEFVDMDLDKQSVRTISIRANVEQLCEKLRKIGFIHPIKDQACSCERLMFLSDLEIIKHYNSVITGTLNWFSGSDNFQKVKSVVESILRKSCLLTLKRKFKMKSIQQALDIYGRNVAVKTQNKTYSLITKDEVAKYRNSFNLSEGKNENEFNLYKIIDKVKYRSHGLSFFHNCAVVNCEIKDIEIHHINKLQRKRDYNGVTTVIDKKGRPVKGLRAVLTSINRKQIPLCRLHHMEMERGKYHELNKGIINEVLNRNSTKYPLKMPKDFKIVFEGSPFVYDKSNKNTKKS